MANKTDYIKAGFSVNDADNSDNGLLEFLKQNYPSVIKDNEINLTELKALAGLPVDERVNGYGLNFIGRNVARAKYAQKTNKELRLNTAMSKNIGTTQNLVLNGDNLDSLKILNSHYSGLIKCIYIDPPYNTDSDEFVYPDKFDKEEAEVLGLANLSDDDMARLEFSFKTKKSHNGWLSFMYPRLMLARDLLTEDGVIFISIDDNEQANLKLLCDDVFGEENFVSTLVWAAGRKNDSKLISNSHEYMLCYLMHKEILTKKGLVWRKKKEGLAEIYTEVKLIKKQYPKDYEKQTNAIREWFSKLDDSSPAKRHRHYKCIDANGLYFPSDISWPGGGGPKYEVLHPITKKPCKIPERGWVFPTSNRMQEIINKNLVHFGPDENTVPCLKTYLKENEYETPYSVFYKDGRSASKRLKNLLGTGVFTNPKDEDVLQSIFKFVLDTNDYVLDFFAGSGTTGHAVMQLNAEDGGNRKFILCQIDEQIKKDKPAYKFCLDKNLPPIISSITIERLRLAGEKIKAKVEAENGRAGMFEEDKKKVPDIGFKVFDSVDAPKLVLNGEQIEMKMETGDALSRIYNMIFSVGLDNPTKTPEEVVKNCIYKIGSNYYFTNSDKISNEDFSKAIKNGKVFVDGWTASLNATLQNYKEDVKIVF